MDRKAIISRISDRPTTNRPKGSNAAPSLAVMSICTATSPVTAVSTPYSSSQCWCWLRRLCTRSAVAGSSGPVVGMTWIMAVSALALGTAAATISTPSIASTSARMPSRIAIGSLDSTIDPVITSGPLNPIPNSWLTRSNATRSGAPTDERPELGSAISILRAGRASVPRPTTTIRTVTSGHLVTTRTHHRASLPGLRFSSRCALRAPGRSRSPRSPSSAGSRVSARQTSIPTPTAVNMPMTDRNGSPTILRPTRAMMTVRPAKTTADPLVATARAADSWASMPLSSWSRCLEMMNKE